jgi:hypothetical protein
MVGPASKVSGAETSHKHQEGCLHLQQQVFQVRNKIGSATSWPATSGAGGHRWMPIRLRTLQLPQNVASLLCVDADGQCGSRPEQHAAV